MSPKSHVDASTRPPSLTAEQPGTEIFFEGHDPATVPTLRAGPRAGIDQRRVERKRVSKMAELEFDFPGVRVACQVIDESRLGVMLETSAETPVPERLQIRFVNGPSFAALRRWAHGNKIGLEFVGLFLEDEVAMGQVRVVRNVLREVGVHAAVQMLRERDFFQSSQLRTAAEEAEIAIARLESALV
jgi:hypothetical protein